MAAGAEEVMVTIRLVVSLVLVIFGPLANFLVFLCFIIARRLQTVANFFIVCLSIPDFFVSSFMQFGDIYVYFGGDKAICDWLGPFADVCMPASGVALMTIAINRYYLVTRHTFKYRQIFTPFNATLMVIANYILMIFIGILPHMGVNFGKYGWNDRFHVCAAVDPKQDRNSYFVYVMYSLMVFLIMFPVTFLCYFKIFMKVRLSSLLQQRLAERRRRTQEAALAKKLLLLYFTFLAFWTPIVSMFLTDYYGEFPRPAYDFALILCYVRAATNPIFYSWASADFRLSYLQIFKCLRGAKVDFSGKVVRLTSIGQITKFSVAPVSTVAEHVPAADITQADLQFDTTGL